MTKKCNKCKELRPIEEYHKIRKYLSSICKFCHRENCNKHYHTKIKKSIIPSSDYNSLENEIWKDIIGYENIYQVSNFGRVRSLRRLRIVNQRLSKSGYLNVTLRKESNSKLKGMRVNRLVAIAFIENINNKPYVNHINSIKTDNNVNNLEWCTQSENIKHAYKIGTKKPSNKFIKNAMERKISEIS